MVLKGIWLAALGFLIVSYFAFLRKFVRESRLASSGIPARATIRSVAREIGSDFVRVVYEFQSVSGAVGSAVQVDLKQAKQFRVGQVVTVLYDQENPRLNVIYNLSHYKVI